MAAAERCRGTGGGGGGAGAGRVRLHDAVVQGGGAVNPAQNRWKRRDAEREEGGEEEVVDGTEEEEMAEGLA